MAATILHPDHEPARITKEVVESYIFTTARREYGTYGEKLLVRLVELAQREIAGLNFKDGSSLTKVKVGEWGDAEITIPLRDLLPSEDSKNHSKAKQAIRGLMGKFLEYEDDNTYKAAHLLNDVDVDKVSGMAVIRVNRATWNAMLDFSKGFRKYEVSTAMHLRGKYSLRIYRIVSKQTSPITYSIDELKKMWKLEDQYPRVDDFIKNTIAKAKEELDRLSPYSFDYIENKNPEAPENKGRRGRKHTTSITIIPKYLAGNDTLDGVRKLVPPGMLLNKEISDLLEHKLGFSKAGIRANISLLDTAAKETDLYGLLMEITPAALRASNPQGYTIGAIRTHLREKCGIIVEGDTILRGSAAPQRPKRSLKEILED